MKLTIIRVIGALLIAAALGLYAHGIIVNGDAPGDHLLRTIAIAISGVSVVLRTFPRRKPLAFYRILEFLGKFKSHNCSRAGIAPTEWINLSMAFSTVPSEHVYFVPIDYVQEAITALFQKPVTNTAYHITGDSPLTTRQIEDTICGVLRIDGLTVGINDNAKVDSKLMARFVGDLFPYFSSDIVFDQTNVKKAMGEEFLNWEYGTKGLEILIRSYYKDHFPKVEWIQTIASEPIQREPKDN